MDQLTSAADNLFEEVEPVAVLKARKNENGTRDFLVKWSDGSEDSWVSALHTILRMGRHGRHLPLILFLIRCHCMCKWCLYTSSMGYISELTSS